MEAAHQEFKCNGYQGASMDRIAELAHVSKRTVYHHFDSKLTLFKAILSQLINRMEASTELTYQRDQALFDQLWIIAQREVALLRSEEFIELASVAFIELARMPELKAEITACLPGCEDTLKVWLQAAHEDNRLEINDLDLAAQQFIFSIKSFVFYPQLFGWNLPNDERLEFILRQNITMFLGHYTQN